MSSERSEVPSLTEAQAEALSLMPGVLYRAERTWGIQSEPDAKGMMTWRLHDRWPTVIRRLLKRRLVERCDIPDYEGGECYRLTPGGRSALSAHKMGDGNRS